MMQEIHYSPMYFYNTHEVVFPIWVLEKKVNYYTDIYNKSLSNKSTEICINSSFMHVLSSNEILLVKYFLLVLLQQTSFQSIMK